MEGSRHAAGPRVLRDSRPDPSAGRSAYLGLAALLGVGVAETFIPRGLQALVACRAPTAQA